MKNAQYIKKSVTTMATKDLYKTINNQVELSTKKVVKRLLLLIAHVLDDELDLPVDQINQTIERLLFKSECVSDGRVSLEEIEKWAEETGIKIFGE